MPSLDASGRAAGGHCWVERRLFEIAGGWVATTAEPAAKLLLDRHSQHHAWRAAQWWDRLPVVSDVDRDSLVAAPDAVIAEVFGLLRRHAGTAGRLAGLYRVALPRLHAAYQAHQAAADPVSDASVLRTLHIVGPDLRSDWSEGEIVLEGLLTSRAAVQEAAKTVAGLEEVLAGA